MLPSSAQSPERTLWRTRLNTEFLAGKVQNNMYYAYILLCINTKQSRKIFYIGCTDSLEKRIRNHKSKSVKTTKRFDKVILVYYEACENKIDAIKREKQLKTGFGRGYLKKRLGNYLKNIGQS